LTSNAKPSPTTETAEIRSALPASKSIQLQIAAVSSVRSLHRETRRRNVRLTEIGKIRAHQPHIGRHPVAAGRVRGWVKTRPEQRSGSFNPNKLC
jgi:hypothetical protein